MTLFFFRHAFQIKKVAKYSQGVKQVQVMCVVWACCGFLSCSAAWSADQNILVELSKQRCSYQECQWRYMGLQFEEFLSHHTLGSSVSSDLQPIVCELHQICELPARCSGFEAVVLLEPIHKSNTFTLEGWSLIHWTANCWTLSWWNSSHLHIYKDVWLFCNVKAAGNL